MRWQCAWPTVTRMPLARRCRRFRPENCSRSLRVAGAHTDTHAHTKILRRARFAALREVAASRLARQSSQMRWVDANATAANVQLVVSPQCPQKIDESCWVALLEFFAAFPRLGPFDARLCCACRNE